MTFFSETSVKESKMQGFSHPSDTEKEPQFEQGHLVINTPNRLPS